MLAAQAAVRLTDVEALCEPTNPRGNEIGWKRCWCRSKINCARLSDEITHHYLTHTGPARQLRMIAAGRLDTLRLDAGHAR